MKKSTRLLSLISLSALLIFASNNVRAECIEGEDGCMYGWNQDNAEGLSWPGWTYTTDIGYGHPGWYINDTSPYDASLIFPWDTPLRMMEMGGASGGALAEIDPTKRAPSTATGGSFKVYDDDNNEHSPGWWFWYDGRPMHERGLSNENTNRFEFYINLEGIPEIPKTGEAAAVYSGFTHIGTYVCWDTGDPTYGTGDGCPYEGPGNQHYYHYFTFEPHGWIHVQLNSRPQHRRNSFVPYNDPTFVDSGKHYMQYLNQMYIQFHDNENPVQYWLDEMRFSSTVDSSEPNQNEDSITSVWVGYFPNTDKWQIFWQDQSYETDSSEGRNDDTYSTFQVRWSTAPITNANWSQATPVEGEFYTGEKYTGIDDNTIIRGQSSWTTTVWTQFELPDEIEQSNNHIYFAIKDISIEGGHIGTQWPWNRIDGHDAASPYIHTIDYYLRPDNNNTIRADVDNNSTINTTDAMLTLRNSLGLNMSSTNWFSSTTTGDVNCDNVSNSTDAMLILRHSLGLDMTGTGWCE